MPGAAAVHPSSCQTLTATDFAEFAASAFSGRLGFRKINSVRSSAFKINHANRALTDYFADFAEVPVGINAEDIFVSVPEKKIMAVYFLFCGVELSFGEKDAYGRSEIPRLIIGRGAVEKIQDVHGSVLTGINEIRSRPYFNSVQFKTIRSPEIPVIQIRDFREFRKNGRSCEFISSACEGIGNILKIKFPPGGSIRIIKLREIEFFGVVPPFSGEHPDPFRPEFLQGGFPDFDRTESFKTVARPRENISDGVPEYLIRPGFNGFQVLEFVQDFRIRSGEFIPSLPGIHVSQPIGGPAEVETAVP